MGQELTLPDWALTARPADAFAVLNSNEESLSDGIGQSYPVIGYKGKVWSFRHRGERKNFIRLDDGSPASYLDVIILGQARTKSKSYYKKFDPNQSEGDRPICSSIDGVTPDPDVTTKQADHCALCPKNEWKANAEGKKGRECTDYKRLAVLVLPTQTKPLFGGDGVLEPAFLRVPPASLNSLAIMGDTMQGRGFFYSSYITRISFDPNEAHPKMVFRPIGRLSDGEAPVILQMRQDMSVDRIINGGFAEGARSLPNQEGTTLVLPQQSAGLNLVGSQPQPQTLNLQANGNGHSTAAPAAQSHPDQTPPGTGLTQATPSVPSASAPPVTPTTPPATATSDVQTGLAGIAGIGSGLVLPATPPPPTTPAAPSNTSAAAAGDTGAAEASDDDLDQMIAKELAKTK